ncbi:hypothetical protein, partial [Stenotrophomonas maltophilia group sp. RNC7]
STLTQIVFKNKIHSIFIPPLICTNRDGINFRTRRALIFLKTDVLSLNERRQREKGIENIIYNSESTTYDVLQSALREASINFSDKGKATATYWFSYVKRKSSKSKASSVTMKKEIRMLFNTSILLSKLTDLKEIFIYTDNELNLAVFNSNINKTVQTEMYKFLRQLFETREIAGLP